jgi:cob(I)alamin adenosyltransferase
MNARVLIFTGDGKGKTTAALGMALRAAGHGMRSCVIQFIKNDSTTGELAAIQQVAEIEIRQTGRGFLPKDGRIRRCTRLAPRDEGPTAEPEGGHLAERDEYEGGHLAERGEYEGGHLAERGEYEGGHLAERDEYDDHREAAKQGLAMAADAIAGGPFAVVILDEVCLAVARGLLDEQEVLDAVALAAPETCIVLTGRHATPGLIARADTVTEMRCVRHGYQQGIAAQRGVEW